MEPEPVPFESDHFTVHQLSEGVFAAIATPGGAAVSNAGIVDLGGRTLVFDTFLTPQAARDLRLAAQQLTGRDPELIVNSHYHNDHIWGNQVFGAGALFLTTAQTLGLMKTSGREEIQWAQDVSARRLEEARRQRETARSAHARQDSLLWMGYFGGLVEALPALTVRYPDITFEGRLALHGSARSVEFIPFENSHTGSDLILHLPDAKIIFMADLLFVGCHPYLDECDVSSLRRSLQEITAMGVDRLVPGHGPLGTAQDIASNLDYLSVCTGMAQALVARGETSTEAIARQKPPAPFDSWLLSRFFTANLESLCSKMGAEAAD